MCLSFELFFKKKMKNIDPRKYNLSPRIRLQENSSKNIFIVMDRKSRIIMKDGHRISAIAESILDMEEKANISVLTSAPVCSKTREFLLEKNIMIKEF